MKRLLQLGVGGTLLAALLIVLTTAGGVAAAPRQPVSCGQTITKNTVLRQDLVDCVGPGLVIGADGVTLDLGGHTVQGAPHVDSFQCEPDGTGGFSCTLCDAPGFPACGPPATPDGYVDRSPGSQRAAGIDNSGGFDQVTVKHGTIGNYLYGVRFVGAQRLVARDLREGENTYFSSCFVCLEHSVDGVVRDTFGLTSLDRDSARNVLVNAGGTILVDGSRNTIRHAVGVIGIAGDENTIEHNQLSGTFKPLEIFSRGNVVRNNTIEAGEGIWLEGATETLVEHNTVTGIGETTYAIILIDSDRNTIRQNALRGPQPSTVGEPSSKGGIALCRSSGNTIERNQITNGFVGINLGVDSDCQDASLSGNVIRGNTISDSKGDGSFPESSGDGILISPLATNTLIEQNTLLRNTDDGIDVQNPTTILRRNTANRNGDLGIEALSGAVDGGRNVANGNGNPAQCVGVRCT
jgi:parallel beta-helix repeat protein